VNAFPGPHPEPPVNLDERDLPIRRERGPWFRIHRAPRSPLFFGTTGGGRFDDPTHGFGVLYLGADAHAAFVETFGRRTGITAVSWSELLDRRLVRIETTRPLALVDLTGPSLARLGADARLFAGEHAVARRWSRAFWEHPARPDGLSYPARHDPSRLCAAVYERARDAVDLVPLGGFTESANALLLSQILDAYGFDIVGDSTR